MKVKIDIKRTKIKKEIFFSVCAAASIKFRNKKKRSNEEEEERLLTISTFFKRKKLKSLKHILYSLTPRP